MGPIHNIYVPATSLPSISASSTFGWLAESEIPDTVGMETAMQFPVVGKFKMGAAYPHPPGFPSAFQQFQPKCKLAPPLSSH